MSKLSAVVVNIASSVTECRAPSHAAMLALERETNSSTGPGSLSWW